MKWKIQFAHCIFILYVRCTCDFSANALNFKTIFQFAPDVEYFSCNKKSIPPPLLQCFSPLQRQVSVIVIVGYLDQPMDNKNWTKHRKQCTQYLIESPVCILAGPTPSNLDEIFTQVYLQILIYR